MKTQWVFQVIARFAPNVENGGDMVLSHEYTDDRDGRSARDYAEITATDIRRRYGWVVDRVVVVGRESVSTEPGIMGRGVAKYVTAHNPRRGGEWPNVDPVDDAVAEMIDAGWQQRGRPSDLLF